MQDGSATLEFDMFVIGTGPAGQKAAIQAAKLGKRVGICERREVVGGVCINTGTIPSKTLREAVFVPDRLPAARPLRVGVHGKGGHHYGGPPVPDHARDRPRGRTSFVIRCAETGSR